MAARISEISIIHDLSERLRPRVVTINDAKPDELIESGRRNRAWVPITREIGGVCAEHLEPAHPLVQKRSGEAETRIPRSSLHRRTGAMAGSSSLYRHQSRSPTVQYRGELLSAQRVKSNARIRA